MVINLPYQKQVWLENRNKIIRLLNQQPLTFQEIIEKTGLSRAVVNQHLKQLEEEGIITKVYREKKILNVLNITKIDLPFIFRILAENYVMGFRQENMSTEILRTEIEKKGITTIRYSNLYANLKLEERLHAMARRQLAVQLFALLKYIETSDVTWIENIPLGLIGNNMPFLWTHLGIPFKVLRTKETGEKILAEGSIISPTAEKILAEYGLLKISPPDALETEKNFAIKQLKSLLERSFPEELKQIEQIYEEAQRRKECKN